MAIKDDIGASKYHPVLGPCKIAEENLINDKPGRVYVYAGNPDAPELFHVSDNSLRDACLQCNGDGVRDLGGLILPCDSCGGTGHA
jgi:hypothetical protein